MNVSEKSYQSDEQLIELYLRTQNENYFKCLYNRHLYQVSRQCKGFCKNSETARDLSQEVFVKVHHQLYQFQGKSRFSSWLFQVTRNVCLDYLRREKSRMKNVESEFPKEALLELFEEEIMEKEEAPLQRLLSTLPLLEKEILMMKYGFEWPIEEIATFMEMSEGAIKMRLKRAKEKLKHERIF